MHAGASALETVQVDGAILPVELSTNINEHSEFSQQAGVNSLSIEALQPSKALPEKDLKEIIIVTREMAAVMEILTARERTVLEALLKHGGKMTQAEIRQETETPGSTLTGVLASLERHKIITKKEQGRTNAIEISKWFLSQKEDSSQISKVSEDFESFSSK